MSLKIHTVLEKQGPATAIELTDAQVEALGGGKRAAVRVTIDGRSARLRLAVMGGKNLIGLSKAARDELGVDFDDEVDAVVELDDAPRVIEVPADLAAALEASGVRAAFDALPPSQRKEHVRAILDAKKTETRQRRIAVTMQKLSEK